MKSVGFVGQMDNNGFVLCIARIVAAFGKKVILVDATSTQKTRYTVPRPAGISRQEQLITQYDSVEVAIGFNNILELKKHMLSNGEDFNDYEFVFINTDREEMCEEFDIKNAHHIFFTSTFDFSIWKNLINRDSCICIFSSLCSTNEFKKIYTSM